MYETPIYIVNPEHVYSKYINLKTASKKNHKNNETKSSIRKEINLFEDELMSDLNLVEKKRLVRKKESIPLKEAIDKFNLLEYPMPYDQIYEMDIQTYREMELYFYIPAFKSTIEKKPELFRYAGTINVYDRNHLISIRNYYNSRKTCRTFLKNIYKTNYENIQYVALEQISNKLFELINM